VETPALAATSLILTFFCIRWWYLADTQVYLLIIALQRT